MTESPIPALAPSDTQMARVLLGRMIQTLRKAQGIKSEDLGKLLLWSQSKMSKVEGGSTAIAVADLESLIEHLGAGRLQAQQLRFQFELTRLSPLSTRSVIAHGVEHRQRQIREYERVAQKIDQYGHAVVPGLLQTSDYTRGLLGEFGVPERSIEPAIEERQIRQRILAQTLRSFHFILTESLLYTSTSTRQVQVEQLTLLKMYASLGHVRLGIVPLERGTVSRALTGFTIFNSHFVTTETVVMEQHFTDPSDVKSFVDLHSQLADLATYGDQADACISRAIQHFRESFIQVSGSHVRPI